MKSYSRLHNIRKITSYRFCGFNHIRHNQSLDNPIRIRIVGFSETTARYNKRFFHPQAKICKILDLSKKNSHAMHIRICLDILVDRSAQSLPNSVQVQGPLTQFWILNLHYFRRIWFPVHWHTFLKQ